MICSDKTGTLTSGEMTVTDVITQDGERVSVLYGVKDKMDPVAEQKLQSLFRGGLLNTML